MGQYHILVNLDRREYIDPHRLGCGLKQGEQLGTHPGTGTALLLLLASHSTGAGGGDFEPRPEVTGRWRGERIAMVGDYDDHVIYNTGPLQKDVMPGRAIYRACGPEDDDNPEPWLDVSDLVAAAIEAELGGKYQGDGWREFVYPDGDTGERRLMPDMILTSG